MRIFKSGLAMAAALGLVLAVGSCTDDQESLQEPVEPQPIEEPIEPPPPEDMDLSAFSPETVYFAFDDYTLNMDGQEKLNALSDYMKQNQNVTVQVEGHCDERGSVEYNLALGERRAQSVVNYLVTLGVDASRLRALSYGEERPAVDGSSEDAWSKNRRSEFVISN